MPKQVIKNTFETIEGIAKAAQRGVADVSQDATQSLGGGVDENLQGKVLPPGQKQNIKTNDAAQAAVVRQNLAHINQQIVEARRKRETKIVQEEHKQVQQKEVKKFEKQKKESVLSKLIKSYKGTKEGLPKASG